MKRLSLHEAAGTGAPTAGTAPYDDRAGRGYGHTGPARSAGRTGQAGSQYPYPEDHVGLDELFPEDESGPALPDEWESRLGLEPAMHDPLGWSMNVRDRTSFIDGSTRLDLAHLDPRWATGGELTLERVYTISTRGVPGGSRVSGTTAGWSRPPRDHIHSDDEDDHYFDIHEPDDWSGHDATSTGARDTLEGFIRSTMESWSFHQ